MACRNLVFIKHDDAQGATSWSPTNDDRENPIWGWVALNHADTTIELFQRDGSFYREVQRARSTAGSQDGPEWLPLKSPPDCGALEDGGRDLHQIQLLAQRLDDVEFLDEFWNMVVLVVRDMPPIPDVYVSLASPLISRPLALTHVGPSLKSEGVSSDPDPSGYQLGVSGLVGYVPCRRAFDTDTNTPLDLGLDLTRAVSRYNASGGSTSVIIKPAVVLPKKDVVSNTVALPAARAADRAWLKPYVSASDEAVVGGGSEQAPEIFMTLEGRAKDGRPMFEEGPFSGIEGYLIMRNGDRNPGV